MTDIEALQLAAQSGDTLRAKLLVEAGTNVNSLHCVPYSTPLHAAACNGHCEMIIFLIKNGAHTETLDKVGLHFVTQ